MLGSNGVWCGECAYRAWPECMTYCPHHQVENMFQCFYQTFILFLVLFFLYLCVLFSPLPKIYFALILVTF